MEIVKWITNIINALNLKGTFFSKAQVQVDQIFFAKLTRQFFISAAFWQEPPFFIFQAKHKSCAESKFIVDILIPFLFAAVVGNRCLWTVLWIFYDSPRKAIVCCTQLHCGGSRLGSTSRVIHFSTIQAKHVLPSTSNTAIRVKEISVLNLLQWKSNLLWLLPS